MTPAARRPLAWRASVAALVAMLLLAAVSAAPASTSATDQASASAPASATATAGAPMAPEDLERAARDALWWGDFAELERLHAAAALSPRRVGDGFTLRLYFHDALDAVFDRDPVTEDYHRHLTALTARWAREHPSSTLAHQMHLRARTALAWWHRGTGFANTVSPDALKQFHAEIAAAIDYLTRHADVVLRNSEGHALALVLARAAGWSIDRQVAIAEAGLQLAADDDHLHRTMLNSLLPKWGGNAELVDRYINWAADRAAPDVAPMLYARLYAHAGQAQFGHSLFTDTAVQWPRMKAGWQRLVERFPTAYNHNRFAYLACMARDKPAFRDLVERIGTKPVLPAWGSNPGRTLDGCRRWAAEADVPAADPPPPAPAGVQPPTT